MSTELLSCPFCGCPAESNAGGLDIHCSNQYGCLAFDCSMSADDWNRRFVCPDKNGGKVFAGDKVKAWIRSSNTDVAHETYDIGTLVWDGRGLVWRIKTGNFAKHYMYHYDNIELIKEDDEGTIKKLPDGFTAVPDTLKPDKETVRAVERMEKQLKPTEADLEKRW